MLSYTLINMKEKKTKNEFIPHPNRALRLSDETFELLKKKKLNSGLNWDKFIANLIIKNKHV